MKKTLLIFVISVSSILGFGQNAVDALRYSNIFANGDARFTAMGGAFGALGGNISTLHVNPAGIGLYRSSEMSFSTLFTNEKNKSSYNDTYTTATKHKFQVGNGGVVVTSNFLNMPRGRAWKFMQFGVSVNQLKNFHNVVHINGNNDITSISDMFADMANGTNVTDIENNTGNNYSFDLKPAWDSYMINLEPGEDDLYYGAAPVGTLEQDKVISSWGSLYEVALAFGANYNDRFYIGASLGFPVLDYNEVSTFNEYASGDIPETTYRSAEVRDVLNTRATGINFKLGIIFKANDFLRFGAAIHTPTYYPTMQDEWDTKFTTRWDAEPTTEQAEPDKMGFYEYNFTTPLRAIGSVAFVVQKFGLISLDYEYVDYSAARFDANDYAFTDENDDIRTLFKPTSNIRLGTEWKFANFSFRGGYGYYGSPFENNGNDGSSSSYSLGFGYRESNFFFDAAWLLRDTDTDHYLYGYNGTTTNPASINSKHSRVVLTVGMRF